MNSPPNAANEWVEPCMVLGWVKGSYLGPVPGYSECSISDIPQFLRANSVMVRLADILPRFLPYPLQFINRPTIRQCSLHSKPLTAPLSEPKSTLFPTFQYISEALTTVIMTPTVSWDTTPCSLAHRNPNMETARTFRTLAIIYK